MERITGNEVQSMMEAYASVYKTEEQEVISEETQELEEQQGGAMRGIKGPLHYLDTLLQGRKKADEIARNRGVLPKTSGSSGGSGGGSGGNTGSGMTPAQVKAAQDAANKARQQGKMSDLRGGGGNTGKSPTSNLSNALDKPSVVSPKTGETTKFERRLPTMAELRAAQAARKAAKAGGATDREAGYQAAKAGVNAGKATSAPAANTAKPAAAAPAPVVKKKPAPGARNRMRMEEIDIFDTIKEYLIGEGATEEEALKQMLTLTDEQRTEILEGNRRPFSDAGEYPMRDAMRDAGMNRAPHAPVKKAKKKPTTQMASYEPEGELVDEGSCGSKPKKKGGKK